MSPSIFFLIKVLLSAIIIAFVSWLSAKKLQLAGFLTALPLTTLLALAFSYAEWGDSKQSVDYAKSILLAVPVSLFFFLPFLFAQKLSLSFGACYFMGIILLIIGYFLHGLLMKAMV